MKLSMKLNANILFILALLAWTGFSLSQTNKERHECKVSGGIPMPTAGGLTHAHVICIKPEAVIKS
jgi:hypothetical protein